MTAAIRFPWCSRKTSNPASTLLTDVMSTGIRVHPAGGGSGALRSKPTILSNYSLNRRMTAVPIRPFEPVTRMMSPLGFMLLSHELEGLLG